MEELSASVMCQLSHVVGKIESDKREAEDGWRKEMAERKRLHNQVSVSSFTVLFHRPLSPSSFTVLCQRPQTERNRLHHLCHHVKTSYQHTSS